MRFGDSVYGEYMGCYQDVDVARPGVDVFSTFKSPRRMSQRLGIWPDLSKEECARRAAAAGWAFFALTPHEDITPYDDAPKNVTTCWGSNDEEKATEGGLVQGVADELSCSNNFQLRLYRLKRPDMPPPLAGEGQVSNRCSTDAEVFLVSHFQPASDCPTSIGAHIDCMYSRRKLSRRVTPCHPQIH
jgi:hypothetical protein